MFKKYFTLSLLIFTLVLFQTSFFPVFFEKGLNPVLVISLIFALFLLDRTKYALFSAFIGGVLLDILGFTLLGSSSLVFVLCIMATILIRKYVLKNAISQSILCISSVLIYSVFITYPNKLPIENVVYGSILTLLISYVFYYLLSRLTNERKYF